jgi:hypothetical protein
MKLRVIQPFGGYSVGDEIVSQKEIDAILASDQASYVVQVAGNNAPAKDTQAAQ